MSDRRALSGQVLVRLPEATAAAIARLAAAEGLTGASWCRRHLVAAASTEAAEAVPVHARRPPRPPAPAHILELARLRESTAELTGALVQAAIRSREAGRLDTHAELEAALPRVRQAVRDLDALKLVMLAGEDQAA